MRQTEKLRKAQKVWLDIKNQPTNMPHQELYNRLNLLGYIYKDSEWIKVNEEAHPPQNVIEIRIRTDGTWLIKSDLLDRIERALNVVKLQQINKSVPYAQRPPRQHDSAIYYQFIDELKVKS